VRLWAVGDWRPLRQLRTPPGAAGSCTAVAFSPDVGMLAGARWDGTIDLWEPVVGRLLRVLRGHANTTLDVTFSTDGKALASASLDHTVKLWDVRSGRELRTLAGHTHWVYGLAFAPDGRTLASCGADQTVRLWEALPRWERAGQAATRLKEALAARPRDLRLWIDYGQLLAARGDKAGAEAAFTKALQLPSGPAALWLGLGRYLADQGDPARAEAAFGKAVASQPGNAKAWRERGLFHLHRGRTDKAAADFTRAVAAEPDDHWTWFQAAPLLAAGDGEGYRRHRRAMLARFGKTGDPVIAERTAKACLLLPGTAEDVAPAAALADRALRAGERHTFRPYFELSRALADYRRGRYRAAEKRLEELLAGGQRSWDLTVPGLLVQAMARQRLGQAGPARQTLARALQRLRQTVPRVADAGGSWHDWLICQVLRREAEALGVGKEVAPGR
jgi:tetratricopeptide (TPR) repeat protein